MLPEFANGKNNYICCGAGGSLEAKVPTTIVVIALFVVVGA